MGFEQAEEDQSLRHRKKYSLSRKSKSDKKNEKKKMSFLRCTTVPLKKA